MPNYIISRGRKMNKTVLATTIFTSLVVGTANAATVYKDDDKSLSVGGRAEARFNISDANKSDDSDNTFKDKSRARVNLKGKAKINDQFTAFGKYEVELSDSSDTTVKSRYVFAGIESQIGAFSYGKQDSAQVMLTDYTDILSTFGGDAVDLVAGNKDKRENNFVYSGEIAGLTLASNYVVENADAEKDTESYGIAAQYAFPSGLSVGAGYVNGSDGNNVDANQYNLAVSYALNNFYAAATFAAGEKGNTDLMGYEVAASFKVNKFTAQAVYNFNESEVGGVTVENTDYFALEGIYKFNKNLRTYIGYQFQQLDNEEDALQAGVRYDF